jgi:hypothetical protein
MIRGKLTPSVDAAGVVKILIEWVNVLDGETVAGPPLAVEEFQVGPARLGKVSYVTKAEFSEGTLRQGTFWLDEAGNRHFVIDADAGALDMVASGAGG